MTALNDPSLIQLSADSRALVRNAIKSNPGWRAYAEANDCDLGSLTTKEALLACCDALEIDVAKVMAGEPAPADLLLADKSIERLSAIEGFRTLNAAMAEIRFDRAPKPKRASKAASPDPAKLAALVDEIAAAVKRYLVG